MNPRPQAWPATPAERDRWVVGLRGARRAHDPARYQNLVIEDERAADGSIAQVATVFLTGRECPWRCVMCDLWKGTTPEDTPAGALPLQVAAALSAIAAAGASVTQIKLYNAGSFFDPHAVPESDYGALAALLDGFERIVVESHPALIDRGLDVWRDALRRHDSGRSSPTALEVAIGLETAHPAALERLNKRMTPADFRAAAARLRDSGVALRVFLLISPPFISPEQQDEWLVQSIELALSSGADVISLIPTRAGNGAMDLLAAQGVFHPPRLADVERSYDAALSHAAGRARVFVDLWDLDRLVDCAHCFPQRRGRLHAMNLEQRVLSRVGCDRCGGAVRT